MTCISRRSSRVCVRSHGFGGALVAAVLLVFVGGSLGYSVDVAAQGAFLTSPPDVSDTVQESDLAGQYLLVLPTTQLVVGGVQTPPWTVTATITTVSVPSGADPFSEPALTFREVGTSTWLASGATVKAASNVGEAFGVEYRLDLRALGNGAVGDYAFDVTYRLIADGVELVSETVLLTISTSETVSAALSGTVGHLSLTAALLAERYVSLAGSIDVAVHAISNYRLTLSCTVNGAPDSPGLLVISSSGIVVVSNLAGGVLSTNGGLTCQPVRDNPWLFTQSFAGSNSAGQPTIVRVSLQIDLDAIGNGASGEVRQVVATFTLTEE
jgi:hypothetical protein